MSLGLACNFFHESHALPGFLAMATGGYFDEVVMVSSPPSDAEPDEESIELVKAAGVRLVHTTIDAGYGAVRTRCIRECKSDFVMIMDADERFHPRVPLLRCEGTEKFPDTLTPNLSVFRDQEGFDQGVLLKDMIAHVGSADAIRLCRRHWFDAPGEFAKPQQNWSRESDWQLRLVRNSQFVCYDPHHKMHEKLIDVRKWSEPLWTSGDQVRGPFIDHYSGYFKPMEPDQNAEDARVYEMLDPGCVKNMWLGHADGVANPPE